MIYFYRKIYSWWMMKSGTSLKIVKTMGEGKNKENENSNKLELSKITTKILLNEKEKHMASNYRQSWDEKRALDRWRK